MTWAALVNTDQRVSEQKRQRKGQFLTWCTDVNFKAATVSLYRATLLLMCLWGLTALGNSYWLLIVWQKPTLFQSQTQLWGGGSRCQASAALVSLGGHTVYPCRPFYPPHLCLLATTTTTPSLTPHSVKLLAKDRGLFPRCHGDVAREKCKGGMGWGVCSQVCLSRHVWKRVKGERERMRERRRGRRQGGEFVQTPLPMGPCVSV